MKHLCKRAAALLLVLALVLAAQPNVWAAMPARNDGVRHETCVTLSEQAESYYTGAYSWEALYALEGCTTTSSLEAMGSPLYKALQELMTETQTASVSYQSLTSYWPYTDTQPGYSDASLIYSDADSSSYNREHVWPKSRASFYQIGGGADLHHLRPADSVVNSTRGNYTMGNVREQCSTYSTAYYGSSPVLWYNNAADLVEVKDDVKGDVARILLYVYVRWGQPNLTEDVSAEDLPELDRDDDANNGLRVMDNLDTLLQWCMEDPVDAWEMGRNDRVQDVQGNRNVFIDYPELAWLLFGQEIPEEMITPSGAGGQTPDYPITALSNEETWGTVQLDGSRITAFPADGYTVETVTVEPEGAAQVIRTGNVFQVIQVTQAVTVTVHFAPKTAAVITYLVPDGVTVTEPVTSGFVGDALTLPGVTGSPADESQTYSFRGWVESQVPLTTDLEGITVYGPGEAYVPQRAAVTLYALYTYRQADESGSANVFTLLTAEPEDWSGKYVMTGLSDSGEYAHLATGESVGNAKAAVPLAQAGITRQDDTLAGVTEAYTISVSKLENGNYSMALLGAASDCYLYYAGSGNTLSTATSAEDAGAQWRFSYADGAVKIANVGTEGRVLQFNATACTFRCYTGTQKSVNLYAAEAVIDYYLTLATDPCADGHTPVLQGAVEPTCTEDGYSGDVVCAVCGVVLEHGTVLPATGHTWGEWSVIPGNTCTEEGTRVHTCQVCGQVETETVAAPGHEWGPWTVAVKADCFHAGTEIRSCTVCGETETRVLPAGSGSCPSEEFTDLDTGRWYHEGVDFVLSTGLMNGMGGGRFQPDASLTRGQLVTILYRLAGEPETDGGTPFTDVAEGRYYTEAVAWAYANHIAKGMTDTVFAPECNVTREQMVTFLARFASYDGVEVTARGDLMDYVDSESISNYAIVPMEWAVEKGLIQGMTANTLSPGTSTTRAQAAQVLSRYCAAFGE